MDNNTKKCCTCKEVQSIDFFSKNKKSRDGLQDECKPCAKTRRDNRKIENPNYFIDAVKKHIVEHGVRTIDKDKQREYRKTYYKNNIDRIRQYYTNNIDKQREYSRLYYSEHKEECSNRCKAYRDKNKERLSEYEKQYRKDNEHKIKERQKQYRMSNIEKLRSARSERYKANKEYFRLAWHKRRSIIKSVGGKHTKNDVLFILEKQKKKCVACSCDISKSYTIDHIKPISKGGSNNKDNIQLLCKSCNSSKGNKDPIEFMQTLGFLC